MQTTTTSIRDHIKRLLRDPIGAETAAFARWQKLVIQAAANTTRLEPSANRRKGISFFAKMGDIAGKLPTVSVSVRWRGLEVGTLEMQPTKKSPIFFVKMPNEPKSKLQNVFASLRKRLGHDYWKRLEGENGCEWASEPASEFFKLLTNGGFSDSSPELAIEESLAASLRPSKLSFWFQRCALVQWKMGKWLPFKFTVPITIQQKGAASLDKLIQTTKRYGATDILLRTEGSFGGRRKRLAVLELKKPGGKAELSLLQAYAYAVALDEAQDGKHPDFHRSLRRLLGYPKDSPKHIQFAAYAVVAQHDVQKMCDSELTKRVTREAGDDVLTGILGYELKDKLIYIKSAVQFVNGKSKDILGDSRRQSVNFVA